MQLEILVFPHPRLRPVNTALAKQLLKWYLVAVAGLVCLIFLEKFRFMAVFHVITVNSLSHGCLPGITS